MRLLNKEQVKRLHTKMAEATGGPDGIRDESLLESALSAPFQTFDGVELYPTVIEKIARIAYSLVRNHPFVDGNKRIGTYVMLVLLELNYINIDFTDDEIIHIGLTLADGTMDYQLLLGLIDKKMNEGEIT